MLLNVTWPGYGTERCLNVDRHRMANTVCFHHDRVFGHYAVRTPLAASRFRKFITKVGPVAGDVLQKLVVAVATED
jgi:hypothetical protein